MKGQDTSKHSASEDSVSPVLNLTEVNMRADDVLSYVEYLRQLKGIAPQEQELSSGHEVNLNSGEKLAAPLTQEKVKTSKFLTEVEYYVKKVKNALEKHENEPLTIEAYQRCQEDLKSLRRLAFSSYARAAGYTVLAGLVDLLVGVASVAFVPFAGVLLMTVKNVTENRPLSSFDKVVVAGAGKLANLNKKAVQSYQLASGIGLFRGLRHQAKKALEAAAPEAPKKTS